MSAFEDSWILLKNMIDMREYPEGSGRFVTLEEYYRMKNDDARERLNARPRQPVGVHAPHLPQQPQQPQQSPTNDPLGRALENARNQPPPPKLNITSPEDWKQGAGGY